MTDPTITEAEIEAATNAYVGPFHDNVVPLRARIRAALLAAARVRSEGEERLASLQKRADAERDQDLEALFDALEEKDRSEETAFARKWLDTKKSLTASQEREKIWSDAVAGFRIRAEKAEAELAAAFDLLAKITAERDAARAQADALAGALQPWAFSHKSITASWPDDAIVNVTNGATILLVRTLGELRAAEAALCLWGRG